ncbi:MAG: metallophosphoesterase [Thermodesulfobacteria bacterium]|nr:metallophosphoesterase [Thermodesulfobacteriota bacterium]
MRLLHLSDPHFFCPEALSVKRLLNKRILGLANWLLKRGRRTSNEHLELLPPLISELGPKALCITGDLAHLGQAEEFQRAKTWLECLEKQAPVKIVPGNHDIYLKECRNEMVKSFGRFFSLNHDTPASNTQLETIFPQVDIVDDIALIGVSTAYPSGFYKATGRIGAKQLARLEELLESLSREGLFRVMLLHHPPVPGVVSKRKALEDHLPLMNLVRKKGVELVLFGHSHIRFFKTANKDTGTPFLIGAPSITSITQDVPKRAGLYSVDIERAGGKWQVRLKDYILSQDRAAFQARSCDTFSFD